MAYLRCAMAGLFAAGLSASSAQAKTICTAVADAGTGEILMQQGDCGERFTPASTFKIALSVMGFDSGFLQDEHAPALPFQEGYVDWGGDNWRKPADATRWMEHSVVWFPQQMAQSLGEKRLQQYAAAFGYGNADFSRARQGQWS